MKKIKINIPLETSFSFMKNQYDRKKQYEQEQQNLNPDEIQKQQQLAQQQNQQNLQKKQSQTNTQPQNNNSTLKQYKNIKLEKINDNKILVIYFNRPENKNAVNQELAAEFREVIQNFNADDSIYIGILAGIGETFCSGADLKETMNQPERIANILNQADYTKAPLGPTKLIIQKPIIAAVEGYAVAGGLEISLLCDLIVSHKEAIFGVFCRRFAVPLIDGGTVRLAKVLGISRAMDMVLTGRPVKGDEAFQWGLVNRLVEKQNVMQEAINLAKQLCDLPQICMRNDRLSLIQNSYQNLEQQFKTELNYGMKTILSGETQKNIQKFAGNMKSKL